MDNISLDLDDDCLRSVVTPNNYLYDKNYKNISIREWINLSRDEEYVTVSRDMLGGYIVRTAWTGVDFDAQVQSKDPQIFHCTIIDPNDLSTLYERRFSHIFSGLELHKHTCFLLFRMLQGEITK